MKTLFLFLTLVFAGATYAQPPVLTPYKTILREESVSYSIRNDNKLFKGVARFTMLMAHIKETDGSTDYLDPDNYVVYTIRANCLSRKYVILKSLGKLSGQVYNKPITKEITPRPESSVHAILDYVCKMQRFSI